ncbi:MAG: helix-turn-helix transcriptional regulator [Clostridia bacterium]|nr:helix-turn-helix transcriptional regulator [Clostridia bacterium]
MKISENIKKFREQRNLSQSDLAKVLFVTPQSISRWETGIAYPDIEKLPQIASFFGVTIDELMGVAEQNLYSLSQRLIELRKNLSQGSPNVQLEYFNTLEKTVEQGTDLFMAEYQAQARKLYDKNLIDYDRYKHADDLVRKMLYSLPPVSRINKLRSILMNESDENLSLWSEFASHHNTSTWNDLLLLRAHLKNKPDEWRKLRCEILYDDISKSVFNITQRSAIGDSRVCAFGFEMIENLNTAKKLINCFSSRYDDLFVFLRITLETRFAYTYLYNKMYDELRMSINDLKSLLSVASGLIGRAVFGSVELFSEYSMIMNRERYGNCLFEIELLKEELFVKEMSDIRDDLEVYVNKLHCELDPYYYIDKKDAQDFGNLYNLVKNRSERIKPKNLTYVIAVKTSKNYIHEAVLNAEDENDGSVEEFLARLKRINDTKIEYIVGNLCDYRQNFCLEMPSHAMREKLCELDKENLDAKILLQGAYGFVSKTINQTFGPVSKLKFDQIK